MRGCAAAHRDRLCSGARVAPGSVSSNQSSERRLSDQSEPGTRARAGDTEGKNKSRLRAGASTHHHWEGRHWPPLHKGRSSSTFVCLFVSDVTRVMCDVVSRHEPPWTVLRPYSAVKIFINLKKKNWMKMPVAVWRSSLWIFFLMQTINNNRIELNRKKAKSPLLGISTIKYDSTWISLSSDACCRGWAKQTIWFHFFSS